MTTPHYPPTAVADRGLCERCTEPRHSQVHFHLDPNAVRGPYDIPHHEYVAPKGSDR